MASIYPANQTKSAICLCAKRRTGALSAKNLAQGKGAHPRDPDSGLLEVYWVVAGAM